MFLGKFPFLEQHSLLDAVALEKGLGGAHTLLGQRWVVQLVPEGHASAMVRDPLGESQGGSGQLVNIIYQAHLSTSSINLIYQHHLSTSISWSTSSSNVGESGNLTCDPSMASTLRLHALALRPALRLSYSRCPDLIQAW